MRGHRAKQYRKLMHQYSLTFNFREPYQVLLDSAIIQDAARFKMDLVLGLERTLQGKVKPMVSQCSMRHLYAKKDQALISQAQKFERRRCNHHELEDPLATIDCLSECVDPKDSRTNKNRYVVASQDPEVRAKMRRIPGVPLIYVSRSVMILEPMASATEGVRARAEKEKFRLGIKGSRGGQVLGKRSRGDEEVPETHDGRADGADDGAVKPVQKRGKSAKQPNPLSVRKSMKTKVQQLGRLALSEDPERKKRRRKKKAADTRNQDPVNSG